MESHVFIPADYRPPLDIYDVQRAITYIKDTFQNQFAASLHLKRVSAPLFVTEQSGLNDNLNGYERPVSFDIPAIGVDAQIVQSLAKWKRMALARYDFAVGNGLYTDMNAIRRDENIDNIHSIYVDQWDWERSSPRNHAQRNICIWSSRLSSMPSATPMNCCVHFTPSSKPISAVMSSL